MIFFPRWLMALTLYLLILYLLISLQPSLMFDPYGKPKEFGLGLTEGKSILAPSFSFPVLAIISYYITSIIQFVMI
jgi:hypothetical protein